MIPSSCLEENIFFSHTHKKRNYIFSNLHYKTKFRFSETKTKNALKQYGGQQCQAIICYQSHADHFEQKKNKKKCMYET